MPSLLGALLIIVLGIDIIVKGELRHLVVLGEEKFVIGGAIIAIGFWILVYLYISVRKRQNENQNT